MPDEAGPDGVPHPEELDAWFHLEGVSVDGDRVRYLGESLVPESTFTDRVFPAFHQAGYEVRFRRTEEGKDVLVAWPTGSDAAPTRDGFPWLNLVLLLATVCTTLFVGAVGWYYIPLDAVLANPLRALEAWPFTAAVLGVLLTHEMGHYVVARYHGVDATLPYVIPFFLPFGTMGAVIRMRSRMPDRKTLFDIGAAGPLAGLVATVVVTAIGLSMDPMQVPQSVGSGEGALIAFHNPPLLELIAGLLNEPTSYGDGLTAHPVIIGGWIGMFFTLLNLLPVGQLDGGHIVRAVVGERQETVASLVPAVLFGLAGYLLFQGYELNDSVGLWLFWGVFAMLIAYGGPADPVDETPLGWKRVALGVLTFALGALCFLPMPIEVISA